MDDISGEMDANCLGPLSKKKKEMDANYAEEEDKMQAHVELVADLRKMVNGTACSDVVFVCEDGGRVPACRMLLVNRSEMLRCMLMNGMAESNVREIKLPAISSRVLLSVFEYLYTADMLDYPLLSWRMGLETIIAAQFFILPRLENTVEGFLLTETSKVADDLPKAAVMLNEAMEFKSYFEEKGVVLLELVRVLSPRMQPIYVQGLSEDALHYLLTKTRSKCEDDGILSFKEYLRFRQVMFWWICKFCFGDPEELVNVIVPDDIIALSLLRRPRTADDYRVQCPLEDGSNQSQHLNYALLEKSKREVVQSLLSNIDCRCIPPILLLKVVAPLKVVSPEEIEKALVFHALCKPIVYKLPQAIDWELGSFYSVLEEGTVIQKKNRSIALAVALVGMSRPSGLYQWSFIIEECCEEFLELGFLYTMSDFQVEKLKERTSNKKTRLSNQQDARVLSDVYLEGSSINWQVWQGDCEGQKKSKPLWTKLGTGSIVMFHYNVSERNCSIFIDGKDYGIAWSNLPIATYYPAVCLGSGGTGRIRMKLVSGFDIL